MYKTQNVVYIYEGDIYSHFPEFVNYHSTLITRIDELENRGNDPFFEKNNSFVLVDEKNSKENLDNIMRILSEYGFVEAKQILEHDKNPWCNDVYLVKKA